jgi:hypothetical protein
MKKLVVALVLPAFSVGCMPILVAPPARPSQTLPDVQDIAGPTVADRIPVVIDSVDGPTAAYRTTAEHEEDVHNTEQVTTKYYDSKGNYDHSETETHTYTTVITDSDLEPLCVTPCVAWLPKGESKIHLTPMKPMNTDGFDVMDTVVNVHVRNPQALRVNLAGERTFDHGVTGGMLMLFGSLTVVAGAVATPFSLTRSAADGDADAWLTGGLVTLGVGVGLFVIGAVIAAATRGSRHDASHTSWAIAPPR